MGSTPPLCNNASKFIPLPPPQQLPCHLIICLELVFAINNILWSQLQYYIVEEWKEICWITLVSKWQKKADLSSPPFWSSVGHRTVLHGPDGKISFLKMQLSTVLFCPYCCVQLAVPWIILIFVYFYPIDETWGRGILLTVLSGFCPASRDVLGSATSAAAVHFITIKYCRKV